MPVLTSMEFINRRWNVCIEYIISMYPPRALPPRYSLLRIQSQWNLSPNITWVLGSMENVPSSLWISKKFFGYGIWYFPLAYLGFRTLSWFRFFLFQIQRPRRTSNRELVGITRFVVIKRTRVHERLQYSNHIGDFNIEKNLSFSELERILFFGAFAFVCIRLYLPEHRMEIFVPKMHFSECLSSRVSTQFNWIYLLCAIRQPIVIVLTLFLLVCSPFFGLLPHIYPTDASIWMWTSRSKIAKEA